jgi:hypothetical protein
MPDRPRFDRDLANLLVGKHVLVGMTYLHHDGTLDRQEQVHGFVTRADEQSVVIERWGGGDETTLPPDTRPFQPAPPGEYRLRSTGEVVVDPDYLASWTVTAPAPD